MRKNQEEPVADLAGVLLRILKGGAVALAAVLVELLLCAGAVSAGVVGEGAMGRLAVGACLLGGFMGGKVALKRCVAGRFATGLGAGCALFLWLLLGSAIVWQGPVWSDQSLWVSSACLLGGALSGLTKRRKGQKKRRN